MLGESKFKIFLDLISNSGKDELIWMNGYLNGVVQKQDRQNVYLGNLRAKLLLHLNIAIYPTASYNCAGCFAGIAAKSSAN